MAVDIVTSAAATGAGSLANTLAAASAGDTIEFAANLSGDTIDLAATLDITKNITIIGNANGAAVSLSGGDAFTDVKVEAGVSANLSGLDIINGAATGVAGQGESVTGLYETLNSGGNAAGGIYNAGTLTISNTVFSSDSGTGGAGAGNHYHSDGGGAGGSAAGGIYDASGSLLNINTSTVSFSGDSAQGGHGGQGASSEREGYVGGAGGTGGSQVSGGSATGPTAGSAGSGNNAGAGGAKGVHGGYGHGYIAFPGLFYNGAGGGGGGGYAFANYGGKGTVQTACFRRGTRLATPGGEVAVETICAGDLVTTLLGDSPARVRWVGYRDSDCTSHPTPADLWPVRIAAHAFGPGQPQRDLWLSPGHAVYVPDDGGALIPVRFLVNGASIAQVTVPAVSYFHVELDRHDALLAEGLPAESYLDTGNRAAFANHDGPVQAYPDFGPGDQPATGCAPLLAHEPLVIALRQRLLARATALGWTRSAFPALRVAAAGRTLVQAQRDGQVRVRLPAGTTTVCLLSRRAVPPDLLGDQLDSRSLGVLVKGLALDDVALALEDARLGEGWHAPEPGVRWTDGAATLDCTGATTLSLRIAAAPEYWLEPEAAHGERAQPRAA